jgi:hypothetical protein
MISFKINLTQLNHARMKTPKGADVVVIPINENSLFVGEKGIYLDIVGFEVKNPENGKDTHILKQSFSKEVRAAMPEEVLKALPIIGNARISSGQAHAEPEPRDMNNGTIANGIGDLPF